MNRQQIYQRSVDIPKHDKVMDAVLETSPFYGVEIKNEEDYKFSQRG